jgi:triosephosphate isomerase
MRKKIVAGNWKMNLLWDEALGLAQGVSEASTKVNNAELIVFPPFIFAPTIINKNPELNVGLQNFYPADKGAFTGEVSITQAKNIGAKYVLIGHSERRAIFNENEVFLKEKVNAALANDLTPVFCCGESLEIREANEELNFVKQQLMDSLFHLSADDMAKCIVAYEPVWAIGTGKTASVEQAESMHKSIRSWIAEHYSKELSEEISILYGGSCNASNAKELFACENVDGGLIGGAALQLDAFISIAQSF